MDTEGKTIYMAELDIVFLEMEKYLRLLAQKQYCSVWVESSGKEDVLTCGFPHYSFIGLIVGLVVGAVAFVIVLAIVAVCLCSKRCLSDKKDKHIGLHSYSPDSSRNKGNRRDHSREDLTINSCYYTLSPDISSPNNEIVGNINATTDNIEYASICKPTKHAYRTDDMYDHTFEEKMPQFQSTYDHLAANSFVDYDKTYSMTKDKPDVCGTYEDVTMGFDDAYDKTYVRTGAKSDPDKTYDHVTSITSETYVTT